MPTEADFAINPSVYEWTGRSIALLERVLKVNIKLHHRGELIETGEIFLFNHFARFETFIPQYLIHRETGDLCRSVAAPEFFVEGDPFSRYLRHLGAVPTDWPGLLPFLAAEVLRGRKVVLFPEGGMVKDRRVLEPSGEYRVYSRSAHERRKHHTGAAVLALALDGFKRVVRRAADRDDGDAIDRWVEALGLPDADTLVARCRRPTRIVPANITFYPMRITGNLLGRGADWFSGGLSPRISEELKIEGNILLKDTDMDIRLAPPVVPSAFFTRTDRWLVDRLAARGGGLQEWFSRTPGGWVGRWWGRRAHRAALRIRDAYMASMYGAVTVNLSHLASAAIIGLIDRGVRQVPAERFHRIVYLAAKGVQVLEGIDLHRGLLDPAVYACVPEGECRGLDQFLATAERAGLVERTGGWYRFLPALRAEHEFDRIRLENPVGVYANEVAPLKGVEAAVAGAVEGQGRCTPAQWARHRFDDELRRYRWDRKEHQKPRYDEVNVEETFGADASPFLWVPEKWRGGLGVVLVHGFTASPAEVRPFAERLRTLGYPVMAVRLAGHGTSPWDLHDRSWREWLGSVRRGYRILRAFCREVVVVGFSAGGALALLHASERPEGLAGVVSVSAPVRLRDRGMLAVPLVHGANRLAAVLPGVEGVFLFHHSEPEHPDINYRHMPIEALHDLAQLADEAVGRATEVVCPALVIQGTEDPTVVPESAQTLFDALPGPDKDLLWIDSDRHGLLYENIGETWPRIESFLEHLDPVSEPPEGQAPR